MTDLSIQCRHLLTPSSLRRRSTVATVTLQRLRGWFLRGAALWTPSVICIGASGPLSAQVPARAPLHCYYGGNDDTLGEMQLARGRYVLTVEHTSDSSDTVEHGCAATIRDREGRVAYREEGFGVSLDSLALDFDVDGDGARDLILTIDTGGGNHCCWTIDVISLRGRARRILSVQRQGAAGFFRDPMGRAILRSWEGGFGSERYGMVGRVAAERIYRWRRGALVDVTAWMCRNAKGTLAIDRSEPDDEDAIAFRHDGSIKAHDGTASSIESLMLQHCLCGDIDRARDVAVRWWPKSDLTNLLTRFAREASAAFPHLEGKFAAWAVASDVR